MPQAYFVQKPRRSEELCVPHDVTAESKYKIEKIINLKLIDYENFCGDMLVSRELLENSAKLCGITADGVYRCLCVRSEKSGGPDILVLPDSGGFVLFAAVG